MKQSPENRMLQFYVSFEMCTRCKLPHIPKDRKKNNHTSKLSSFIFRHINENDSQFGRHLEFLLCHKGDFLGLKHFLKFSACYLFVPG